MAVDDGEAVLVAVEIAVDEAVGVAVCVRVAVGAGVDVRVAVGVDVGVRVGVRVGDAVAVAVAALPPLSYAPLSNPFPSGRAVPSRSTVTFTSVLPASIAGLPAFRWKFEPGATKSCAGVAITE